MALCKTLAKELLTYSASIEDDKLRGIYLKHVQRWQRRQIRETILRDARDVYPVSAKEFDVDITLEHVTEGHLIVDELVEANKPLAVGPTFGHSTKFELQYKCWETPGVLAKAGCHVSIITDAPVIPLHHLPLCAGFAIKAGMDEYDALRAITINPAEHIGVADHVGSLEEGKDADIVIMDGTPFTVEGKVKHVLIDGKEI